LQPEHIGWSVRHARELVPTERIRCGPSALPVRRDPRDPLLDLEVETSDGVLPVRELVRRRSTDVLLVLHRGDLVLEWGSPGHDNDEPHLLFSVTKSITGLLALALATADLLDLSARVGDIVPEAAGNGFADVTVRQLLDMEASYAFVEDYTPGPDLAAYRHAAGWYPSPEGAPALREFLAKLAPDGEHGRRFRYLSPTTDMLGWVCARAAGTTYAQAVSRYLWQPMGAEADADVTVDREGTPRAAGGVSALPRDVARLGRLVADRGAGIVAVDLVDDLLRAGDRWHWADGDFADLFPGGAYRSCWYEPHLDPDAVCGIGIHGQMLYVDVPRGVVVVVLSSWPEPDDEDWHRDNHTLCRTIARSLDT
jgi:CubicO group peptidase (beta-lactamase class C family)